MRLKAALELYFAMAMYTLFEAYVYQLIWFWFAAPTLHVPALTKIETIVMLWVIRRIVRLDAHDTPPVPPPDVDPDHNPELSRYVEAILHDALVLGVGFAIRVVQVWVQKLSSA